MERDEKRDEIIEYLLPQEIERRSFEIISEELRERGIQIPPDQESITKRIIDTTALS